MANYNFCANTRTYLCIQYANEYLIIRVIDSKSHVDEDPANKAAYRGGWKTAF